MWDHSAAFASHLACGGRWDCLWISMSPFNKLFRAFALRMKMSEMEWDQSGVSDCSDSPTSRSCTLTCGRRALTIRIRPGLMAISFKVPQAGACAHYWHSASSILHWQLNESSYDQQPGRGGAEHSRIHVYNSNTCTAVLNLVLNLVDLKIYTHAMCP